MAATVFYQSSNELATLTNTFKVDGTPTDPTSATLTITSPSNVVTVYSWPTGSPALTRTGTGAFSQDVTCNEAGDWTYLWEGTTADSDAQGGTWTVYETSLGKLYGTVEALKSRLRITDSTRDYELHMACFAASRAVEQVCERTFYRSASGTARTFVTQDLWWLKLGPFNDLVSVSALATDSSGDGVFETSWSSSEYQLLPVNPGSAPETRPYTRIKAVTSKTFPIFLNWVPARDDRVQITGVWGWPAVPLAVKNATLMLAEELMKDTATSVSSAAEYGGGRIRVNQNPRIQSMLQPYIHPDAAVKIG